MKMMVPAAKMMVVVVVTMMVIVLMIMKVVMMVVMVIMVDAIMTVSQFRFFYRCTHPRNWYWANFKPKLILNWLNWHSYLKVGIYLICKWHKITLCWCLSQLCWCNFSGNIGQTDGPASDGDAQLHIMELWKFTREPDLSTFVNFTLSYSRYGINQSSFRNFNIMLISFLR